MMLRHGLGRPEDAERIEAAVDAVLERGLRTPDLAGSGEAAVGTEEATEAVLAELGARARSPPRAPDVVVASGFVECRQRGRSRAD